MRKEGSLISSQNGGVFLSEAYFNILVRNAPCWRVMVRQTAVCVSLIFGLDGGARVKHPREDRDVSTERDPCSGEPFGGRSRTNKLQVGMVKDAWGRPVSVTGCIDRNWVGGNASYPGSGCKSFPERDACHQSFRGSYAGGCEGEGGAGSEALGLAASGWFRDNNTRALGSKAAWRAAPSK